MEHYVIKPAGEAGEAAVHAGLRAYNRTFVSDTADLSLVVEDEAGQIIGGCDAFRMGELALLDVLTLGKDQAINLGVDYDRCIRRLLLGVTLCIAVATAMVGPISFLGLIIANLSRQLLRTYRHSQLILGSAFFGMIVLVGGQLIVEHVFTYAIPVSVFITVGGGLYFLYLLLTKRRV